MSSKKKKKKKVLLLKQINLHENPNIPKVRKIIKVQVYNKGFPDTLTFTYVRESNAGQLTIMDTRKEKPGNV